MACSVLREFVQTAPRGAPLPSPPKVTRTVKPYTCPPAHMNIGAMAIKDRLRAAKAGHRTRARTGISPSVERTLSTQPGALLRPISNEPSHPAEGHLRRGRVGGARCMSTFRAPARACETREFGRGPRAPGGGHPLRDGAGPARSLQAAGFTPMLMRPVRERLRSELRVRGIL